jgi:hypothetical protein
MDYFICICTRGFKMISIPKFSPMLIIARIRKTAYHICENYCPINTVYLTSFKFTETSLDIREYRFGFSSNCFLHQLQQK